MVSSRPPSKPGDRRGYWLAALVLFGVLIGAVALTVLLAPSDSPDAGEQAPAEPKSGIIPQPNEGRPPENPGDRGGWEQLATLALIAGGIGLLVLLAWRSSRRARTRSQRA